MIRSRGPRLILCNGVKSIYPTTGDAKLECYWNQRCQQIPFGALHLVNTWRLTLMSVFPSLQTISRCAWLLEIAWLHVWWCKKSIVGRPKLVDGEALAILYGLTVVAAKEWRNVILESDCTQLINTLSGSFRFLVSFGAITDAFLDYFFFSFFFRTFVFLLSVDREIC